MDPASLRGRGDLAQLIHKRAMQIVEHALCSVDSDPDGERAKLARFFGERSGQT
jgi:hypothetical protein